MAKIREIPIANLMIPDNMEEVKEWVDAVLHLTDPKNSEIFVKVIEKIG